jgi:hypothetical protein
MSNIAKNVRMGIAAGAVAIAASAVSVAPAQATPLAPAPSWLGSTAGVGTGPFWWLEGSPNGAPVGVSAAAPAPQPNLFWLGAPNPNPPARTTILSVNPMGLLPAAVRPFFGWFEALNFEACFAGIGVKAAGYGTVSLSVGRSC